MKQGSKVTLIAVLVLVVIAGIAYLVNRLLTEYPFQWTTNMNSGFFGTIIGLMIALLGWLVLWGKRGEPMTHSVVYSFVLGGLGVGLMFLFLGSQGDYGYSNEIQRMIGYSGLGILLSILPGLIVKFSIRRQSKITC